MTIIIPPLNNDARKLAEQRQQQLTKPTGALGRLETLSCALAAMQGRALPQCERVTLLIFAGDHGVVAQGVSAYPQIVTAHMCMNFSHGGAAMNVLARQADVQVRVIDVGVKEALPPDSGIIIKKIAHGTQDFTHNSAMNDDECVRALAVGAEQADEVIKSGVDVLAFGEMGIGNTTSASALFAALTGLSPALCVGRGTGISDDMLQKKISVVELGLARHQVKHSDPVLILAALGGYEIAAMVGGMLQAASQRVPIIVDGFIASVAAYVASRINPAVRDYFIFAHKSAEGPHALVLEHLQAQPLLDLGMRLGEGSGALMAVHIIRAACRTLAEMATFADAGVANKTAAG
jgi:nicotinate-nucleotide--dimethylbenzimidazole phosphoribosyltransferase